MAIFRIIRFFRAAAEFSRTEEGTASHQSYHRRIVLVSVISGIVVGVAGTTGVFSEKPDGERDYHMLILSPFLFFMAGAFLGVGVSCLFAPRDFFLSPTGAKWMRLSGAKTVGSARFVFFALALVIGGIAGAVALASILQAKGILPPPTHFMP
jgi:hypothetical protein